MACRKGKVHGSDQHQRFQTHFWGRGAALPLDEDTARSNKSEAILGIIMDGLTENWHQRGLASSKSTVSMSCIAPAPRDLFAEVCARKVTAERLVDGLLTSLGQQVPHPEPAGVSSTGNGSEVMKDSFPSGANDTLRQGLSIAGQTPSSRNLGELARRAPSVTFQSPEGTSFTQLQLARHGDALLPSHFAAGVGSASSSRAHCTRIEGTSIATPARDLGDAFAAAGSSASAQATGAPRREFTLSSNNISTSTASALQLSMDACTPISTKPAASSSSEPTELSPPWPASVASGGTGSSTAGRSATGTTGVRVMVQADAGNVTAENSGPFYSSFADTQELLRKELGCCSVHVDETTHLAGTKAAQERYEMALDTSEQTLNVRESGQLSASSQPATCNGAHVANCVTDDQTGSSSVSKQIYGGEPRRDEKVRADRSPSRSPLTLSSTCSVADSPVSSGGTRGHLAIVQEVPEPATPGTPTFPPPPEEADSFNDRVAKVLREVRGKIGTGPLICVMGSDDLDNPGIEKLVEATAKELVKSLPPNTNFITQGKPGIQAAFAMHYVEGSHLWHLLPAGQQSACNNGEILYHEDSDEEVCKHVFEQIGDVYITVGGGPDTSAQAAAALSHGAALVPLKCSGGASSGLFGFPKAALEQPSWVDWDQWELLEHTDLPADQIAAAVANVASSYISDKKLLSRSARADSARVTAGHLAARNRFAVQGLCACVGRALSRSFKHAMKAWREAPQAQMRRTKDATPERMQDSIARIGEGSAVAACTVMPRDISPMLVVPDTSVLSAVQGRLEETTRRLEVCLQDASRLRSANVAIASHGTDISAHAGAGPDFAGGVGAASAGRVDHGATLRVPAPEHLAALGVLRARLAPLLLPPRELMRAAWRRLHQHSSCDSAVQCLQAGVQMFLARGRVAHLAFTRLHSLKCPSSAWGMFRMGARSPSSANGSSIASTAGWAAKSRPQSGLSSAGWSVPSQTCCSERLTGGKANTCQQSAPLPTQFRNRGSRSHPIVPPLELSCLRQGACDLGSTVAMYASLAATNQNPLPQQKDELRYHHHHFHHHHHHQRQKQPQQQRTQQQDKVRRHRQQQRQRQKQPQQHLHHAHAEPQRPGAGDGRPQPRQRPASHSQALLGHGRAAAAGRGRSQRSLSCGKLSADVVAQNLEVPTSIFLSSTPVVAPTVFPAGLPATILPPVASARLLTNGGHAGCQLSRRRSPVQHSEASHATLLPGESVCPHSAELLLQARHAANATEWPVMSDAARGRRPKTASPIRMKEFLDRTEALLDPVPQGSRQETAVLEIARITRALRRTKSASRVEAA